MDGVELVDGGLKFHSAGEEGGKGKASCSDYLRGRYSNSFEVAACILREIARYYYDALHCYVQI